MILVKKLGYVGAAEEPVEIWAPPVSRVEEALAEEVIEVSSFDEAIEHLSANDADTPKALNAYSLNRYGSFSLEKDGKRHIRKNFIQRGSPSISSKASMEDLEELLKNVKEIAIETYLFRNIYRNEDDYEPVSYSKVGNMPWWGPSKYWILNDTLVFNKHDGLITSDPAIYKRAMSSLRRRDLKAKKVETKKLDALLLASEEMWQKAAFLPAFDKLFNSHGGFVFNSFKSLCEQLPHLMSLTDHLKGGYGKSKIRKWDKLSKEIMNCETEISNEIYAKALDLVRTYGINYVYGHLEADLEIIRKAYPFFSGMKAKGLKHTGYEDPKGVQLGIERAKKVIDSKLKKENNAAS
jgi:hypothetical protein